MIGPLVDWIVEALGATQPGRQADVPATALARLGIADDNPTQRALAVSTGSFVVLAQGSAVLVECARLVLASTGASQLELALPRDSQPVPLHA